MMNSSETPPVPTRMLYKRSMSDMPSTTTTNNNNNNKINKPPLPVPRNSLIRSQSAQLYRQQQQQMVKSSAPIPIPGATAHHNHQPIDDNQEKSDVVMAGTSLSRSFTFESSTGVRRKIPVTPVLSTGAQRRNSQPNQHHDTLHYRHGTLVFPGSASSVIGKLTLDLTNNNNTTTTKISNQNAVSVIPLITTNANAGTVSMDGNLLKLCQDGDAGSLSRYLSHHHDQVPCRSLNLADPSGKTGLIHAAMTGNLAVARQLIRLSGLDINLADNEGNTALHLAAQAGHADIVSLLTLCPNLIIDIRNMTGLTALMKAALQGRVRCTRLLLLAGASPVLRDFGRGFCAAEWARLTGRVKCAEIIDKYMDKMQLNPGLNINNNKGATSSEPSLIRSSLLLLPATSGTKNPAKDSWVKNTLKKAMRIVSGGSGSDDRHVRIASTLTGGGVLGASVLLPEGRRTSLPVLLPERPRASDPEFVVPRIQVSYWNTSVGGSIPPPPSATPKSIPAEMRPVTRQRSKSSTRT